MSYEQKYQHIERIDNDQVEGLLYGKVYVQDKLDGTSATLFYDGEKVICGSRNRIIVSFDNDNQGFMKYVYDNLKFENFFKKYPDYILYGEWLVPHTLKTYRDDAWRNVYIFDVMYKNSYLNPEEYIPMLEEFEIDYIPVLATINNPTEDQLYKLLDKATFLIQDGKGFGEGIVCKRYDYKNKYGNQIWGKIVRNEFKTEHSRIMGALDLKGAETIEQQIINKYCTKSFIEKEYIKFINDEENIPWDNKNIPKLIGIIWHTFIQESIWDAIKLFKVPTINFKRLNTLTIQTIKETLTQIF